jgi:hypothetical protein
MGSLLVSRCRRCGRRRPRECRWWCACSPPGRAGQPLGSMPKPRPARTVVVVFIAASSVGVDGAAACGTQGGGDAHRNAPCQPLSSMRRPAPARTVVVVVIGILPCQPLSSMRGPIPARTVVIVFISPSAVGIHLRSQAGAERGRGVHRALSRWGRSSSHRRRGSWSWCSWQHLLLSRWDRCRSRTPRGSWSWCSSRPQPSGSISQPAPARTVVVVFMASSFDRVRVSRRGRSPSRRRRGGVSRCSSSAVRVDARPVAGADGGGRGHGGLLSAVGVDAPARAGADLRGGVHRLLSRWSAVGIDGGTRAGAQGRGGAHGPFSRVRSGCGKAAEVLPF